jgi:hypothetical protein
VASERAGAPADRARGPRLHQQRPQVVADRRECPWLAPRQRVGGEQGLAGAAISPGRPAKVDPIVAPHLAGQGRFASHTSCSPTSASPRGAGQVLARARWQDSTRTMSRSHLP